ncbi:MAG: phosphoadenylyl-sulfate reductase [Pirellulales bacterium]|nr:phosphoadenylyl-sulfate reductase [Pirellulales bacterium]
MIAPALPGLFQVLETPSPVAVRPELPSLPPADFLDELRGQSERLESATPLEILDWAVQTYYPKLTMATAFGPEGCVILWMLSRINKDVHVFNLDTGYQFAETLKLRDEIAQKYGIEVELTQPETTVAQYEALHGGPIYKTNPDQCCFDRKISVLKRKASQGWTAWMSGIRRDQSPDRAKAAIVGWDKKFGLVKISPLANATKKDIWKWITENKIPYNPLHDQGYTSIGCWPCTRSVMDGEDERAGRWSGFAKKECGLHTAE